MIDGYDGEEKAGEKVEGPLERGVLVERPSRVDAVARRDREAVPARGESDGSRCKFPRGASRATKSGENATKAAAARLPGPPRRDTASAATAKTMAVWTK